MEQESPGAETDRTTRGRQRALVTAAIAVAAALALWVWTRGAERRAIVQLPPEQRQQIYARTLENLNSLCGADAEPRLRGYCQEQARFILQFPECGSECESLARASLAQPVR